MVIKMTLRTKNSINGVLLILPFMIGFALFYLIPFILSIQYTFTKGAGGMTFVGFKNYLDIFKSDAFQLAVYNTFRFILIGVPLLMIVSFCIALLLSVKFRASTFFRSVFLYPLVIPVASSVVVIQAFFSESGLVNQLFAWMNIPIQDWLNSEYAFPILTMIYIWKNCGYNLVLFLAGLNSIPKEYRESAAAEGASYGQIVRYITMPLLIPNFFFVFIISIINSFKSFREAYLLGGNSPHESIYMLQHFLNNNFQNLNYSRLSVAALITFAVIFALLLVLFRLKKRTDVIM